MLITTSSIIYITASSSSLLLLVPFFFSNSSTHCSRSVMGSRGSSTDLRGSNTGLRGAISASNRDEPPICSCGSCTTIRTSWTEANPGRRFHCCRSGCGFVEWLDPKMCERSRIVIPGLLKRINECQELAITRASEVKKYEEISTKRASEVSLWMNKYQEVVATSAK
ncbi:hypothetical protein QVD17_12682 [Tagetes erecta]|uniref:Zinc finger GRF-type domain-containing protein n=1 Tax=Tagetes erecta TaxID=13708 RepID=A0AAD8P312_TARER|nr:hypothetical protein QVD17_12682 [Tagetes erecta]